MERTDAVRRTIRTVVQTGLAVCAVLLVIVPVVLEAVANYVTPGVYATLVGAAAAIMGVAGLVTRVMAMPAVVDFIALRLPWLAANAPEPELPTSVELETDSWAEPSP